MTIVSSKIAIACKSSRRIIDKKHLEDKGDHVSQRKSLQLVQSATSTWLVFDTSKWNSLVVIHKVKPSQ